MITELLTHLHRARVLVVGDMMLDHYWSGSTERVSPEAPVPVVNVDDEEYRAGGAANVAVNIAALGANAILLGHVGQDHRAELLKKLITSQGVDYRPLVHPHLSTIAKLRVLSQDQQLIRLDFDQVLPKDAALAILPLYEDALKEIDVVILSDYGKGAMACAGDFIRLARAANKPVFVDPKSKKWSDYQGATFITPNMREFEQAIGESLDRSQVESQLVAHAERCIKLYDLTGLLVTRGKYGLTLVQKGHPPVHMPTLAREVYDVSGAGDSVIATLATSIAVGISEEQSACLANLAGGIVVGKLGTATVSYEELVKASTEPLLAQRGVVSVENCEQLRLVARAQGKRVVMTNGCFDLLHHGHVQYLNEARALGDYLIVAVNSDASVRKLKGPARPINLLSDRMALIAALHSVDWVISFDEETPEALYSRLLPDVIVKGGDYKPHEVVGHESVVAAGGEVKILSFVQGYSSTQLIEKVRKEEEV